MKESYFEKMKINNQTQEGFLTTKDSSKLFYRQISPEDPKAWVLLVHGLGEHCGRYKELTDLFTKNGFGVLTYDQRGHGKTPGIRSDIPNFESLITDLKEVSRRLPKPSPELPIFLMGHSFGGQVVINYLSKNPNSFSGVILSSPNVKLAMPIPYLKKLLGSWVAKVLPIIKISSGLNPKDVSRDPKEVEEYESDPLVHDKVSLRLGDAVLKNLEIVKNLGPKIKMPALVIYGTGDKITSPEGVKDFYLTIASHDKKLIEYPDYYHETFHDFGKEKVFDDLLNWLEEKSKPSVKKIRKKA